mmetsp:Transcript_47156/g.122334  ORF Transcript_47156/g.122334 Transcript_47156/m.122334 type:complete len:204 (+) Transcript_47156:152-763(+)
MHASSRARNLEKKVLKSTRLFIISATPKVSRMLCIERIAIPRSTARIPVFDDMMGPMVLPHGQSFLTANSCTATPACRAISRSMKPVSKLVAYLWFSLDLIAVPLFIMGMWPASCFPTQLGCTACAVSADRRKLFRIDTLCISSSPFAKQPDTRSTASSITGEPAPERLSEPTSSWSKQTIIETAVSDPVCFVACSRRARVAV